MDGIFSVQANDFENDAPVNKGPNNPGPLVKAIRSISFRSFSVIFNNSSSNGTNFKT